MHALLLAVATVPLFVRRSRPLLVLLLVLGASWVQFELGGQAFQPWFAVVLALYAVGAHAERRAAVVGAVVTAGTVLAGDVPKLLAGDPVEDVVPAWLFLAGIWGLGRWIRSRRRETADLAARAAQAEQDRAAHAAQAVADERARIARELHDLVAHSMGVIVIQSQAGQRAVDAEPDAARAALSAIESSGRQGLAEMRRLLGLLTSRDDGSTTPQPSLRGLDDLVAQVRSAGAARRARDRRRPGRAARRRRPRGLPDRPGGPDQRAQARRSRQGEGARAALRRECSRWRSATTAGGRRPGHGPGHGQVGMRERAALYGGAVEAGRPARRRLTGCAPGSRWTACAA